MTEFNLEKAYHESVAQWKLTHTTNAAGASKALGVEENGGVRSTLTQQSSLIANNGTREGQHAPADHGENPDPATTFGQIECGEEFRYEGYIWEKRTETSAISWYQYEPPERMEFDKDEPVEKA